MAWTKDKFFEKMEWKGDFESMASYFGHMKITDDEDMDAAWQSFVSALEDLKDIYDDWEANKESEEEDE